jgi:hypothetical protein
MLPLPITDIASSNPVLERHIILNANFRGLPLCLLVPTVMALQRTHRPSPFTPDLVDDTVALRFKAMMQKSHQTQQQINNHNDIVHRLHFECSFSNNFKVDYKHRNDSCITLSPGVHQETHTTVALDLYT